MKLWTIGPATLTILAVAAPTATAALKPISLAEGRREAKYFARKHAQRTDAADYSVDQCRKSGKYRVLCHVEYEYDEQFCTATGRVTKTARYFNWRPYAQRCYDY